MTSHFRFHSPYYPYRLGVDIDGVLANYDQAYYNWMLAHQGELVDPMYTEFVPGRDPVQWAWEPLYGFTKATKRAFWDYACGRDGRSFWYNLPEINPTNTQLFADGEHVETYYITSRPTAVREVTQQWLTDRGYTGQLLIAKSGTKGHIVQALGLHAMIDDKPENLVDVLAACGRNTVPLLVDQPWNNNWNHPYVTRVASVAEGVEYAKKLIDNRAGAKRQR